MKTNHPFPNSKFHCTFIVLLLMVFILIHPLAAQSPLPQGATIEKIATGFQFTEGPCWRAAGYLVFSDIARNVVYKWMPEKGGAPTVPHRTFNGFLSTNPVQLDKLSSLIRNYKYE